MKPTNSIEASIWKALHNIKGKPLQQRAPRLSVKLDKLKTFKPLNIWNLIAHFLYNKSLILNIDLGANYLHKFYYGENYEKILQKNIRIPDTSFECIILAHKTHVMSGVSVHMFNCYFIDDNTWQEKGACPDMILTYDNKNDFVLHFNPYVYEQFLDLRYEKRPEGASEDWGLQFIKLRSVQKKQGLLTKQTATK